MSRPRNFRVRALTKALLVNEPIRFELRVAIENGLRDFESDGWGEQQSRAWSWLEVWAFVDNHSAYELADNVLFNSLARREDLAWVATVCWLLEAEAHRQAMSSAYALLEWPIGEQFRAILTDTIRRARRQVRDWRRTSEADLTHGSVP